MMGLNSWLLFGAPQGGGPTSVTVIIDAQGAEIVEPLEAELIDNILEAELIDVVLDADLPAPLDAEIT